MAMKSPNYYRVRAIVRAVFWLALVAGIYLISSRLWWTGADYCWGVGCGL